jgi:hypothetical protein
MSSAGVGQMLPSRFLPSNRFLERLSELLQQCRLRQRLTIEGADDRLTSSGLQNVLEADLRELWRWAIWRINLSANTKGDDAPAPSRVLVLLPRTAPAAHVLRRAAAFAACEVPTVCSFPPTTHASAASVVGALAVALGIEKHLVPSDIPAARLVAVSEPSALVVLTGRRSSAEAVRREARARVVATTGRCVVVTGREPALLEQGWRALREGTLPFSCTRPRWCTEWVDDPPRRGSLRRALQSLHPSAVLFISPYGDQVPQLELDGYSVLPCAPDGSVATMRAFARDPLFGWPGDYLV